MRSLSRKQKKRNTPAETAHTFGGDSSCDVPKSSRTGKEPLFKISRNPSRQLGQRGVHPSSRLIFAFDTPCISFITATTCSPISSRAIHAGTCRGGCACAQCARNDS